MRCHVGFILVLLLPLIPILLLSLLLLRLPLLLLLLLIFVAAGVAKAGASVSPGQIPQQRRSRNLHQGMSRGGQDDSVGVHCFAAASCGGKAFICGKRGVRMARPQLSYCMIMMKIVLVLLMLMLMLMLIATADTTRCSKKATEYRCCYQGVLKVAPASPQLCHRTPHMTCDV
jgi:hypothetical protein